ncbi:MAG TPA: SMC-Scp complex subunit ScpB [Candidatus Cybelea sp.]|nr:SMC-Scp complex subunit ScpB [Candidatus Cybelea sp.]
MSVDPQHVRMAEALLFAASEPLDEATLKTRLPEGADLPGILAELARTYEGRGVSLMKVADRWTFATSPDLAFLLQEHRQVTRKLSRAAVETMAIVAYHQPVTRAEIEEIRGVQISKGTLDVLMEAGWIRMRGRRRVPGRPVTYGTTDDFLIHFGLESLADLPGIEELKAAGLLDPQIATQSLFGPAPGESPGGEEDVDDLSADHADEAEADDPEDMSAMGADDKGGPRAAPAVTEASVAAGD